MVDDCEKAETHSVSDHRSIVPVATPAIRYFALAPEPVPWPEREGARRQKTGGRALSDSEKRLRAKSPVPTNPLRSNLAPLLDDCLSLQHPQTSHRDHQPELGRSDDDEA